MTIFLIGMPGSGKSTIGKALADHLQLPFFDTDEIIAGMEGLTIPEIFNTYGEAHFRQLEKELMEHWKLSNVVVATGGGLPCHNDLMVQLNNKGTTVWVQVSVDYLIQRMNNENDHRPLVQGLSPSAIKTKLKQLLSERKTTYQQAKIRIKGEDEVEPTVRKILRKLYS